MKSNMQLAFSSALAGGWNIYVSLRMHTKSNARVICLIEFYQVLAVLFSAVFKSWNDVAERLPGRIEITIIDIRGTQSAASASVICGNI